MNLFRHTLLIACASVGLMAQPAGRLSTSSDTVASERGAAELKVLQGKWEGVWEGSGADSKPQPKITITITGNSFHFHRDTNFWFDTTITLPAGAEPKQLHATIKNCPAAQADSIGKVVGAIFKIEQGILTLADYDIASDPPKSFADAQSRYVLKKAEPQAKVGEARKKD